MGRKKRTKISDERSNLRSEEDRISQLPDHLIHQIFYQLSTRDVVRTSVLSKRWRSLWQLLPGLDLDSGDFSNVSDFKSFVDKFFDFHRVSWIHKLRLRICAPPCGHWGSSHTSWIDASTKHRIQHLDVRFDRFQGIIPLSLYTCKTLVHLKLYWATLVDAQFVSLSCLKIMHLECNQYPNEATLEKLISCSPILEDLTFVRGPTNAKAKVLKVRSQTLKSLDIYQFYQYDEQVGVVIDAPLLQFLRIKAYLTENYKIINIGLNPKVDLAVSFDVYNYSGTYDLSKKNRIYELLTSISRVRSLIISHDTTKIIYNYKKLEPRVQFCYISYLSVRFSNYDLKMLPTILESCPILESLILERDDRLRNRESELMFSCVPPCLVSSLKYVEFVSPILGYEEEIKLVRYFLKNSKILKKLSLRFDNSYRKKAKYVILQELLAIPRLSSACEVVFV